MNQLLTAHNKHFVKTNEYQALVLNYIFVKQIYFNNISIVSPEHWVELNHMQLNGLFNGLLTEVLSAPHVTGPFEGNLSRTRLWVKHFHIPTSSRNCVKTLRPRQIGRPFADDIFKCILLNENVLISIKISLKFVSKGHINNTPALV